MPRKPIETCQACGTVLESQRELNAWLCHDCLEEDMVDDNLNPLYEPDCEQCGGHAKDGFCRVCQA